MAAIALRNLWERKLRTALTSLAIVLGVMMVAGTYVLTDTIDRSFDDIFTESNEGIDAVVTTREVVETDDGQVPPFSDQVLERVQRTEGVAEAAGGIADPQVSIIGADGEPRGGNGAPSFGFSVRRERFDPLTYVEGRKPSADDEVVIDKASADDEGFALGDQIEIAGKEAVERLHAGRDRDARRRRLVRRRDAGRAHAARGAADHRQAGPASTRSRSPPTERTSPEQLAANLNAALPNSVEAETGSENVESQRDDVGEFIGFLKTALLIFAGVSLFVAAFLIFNTFSITVAQRTREFAMLRTLGANRRQILTSVVTEAFVIGLVAVGARGARRDRLRARDQRAVRGARDRPAEHRDRDRDPDDHRRAACSAPGLTVLAALLPALRATRVPPVTGPARGRGAGDAARAPRPRDRRRAADRARPRR